MLPLVWRFVVARKERTGLLVLGILIVSGAFGLLLGAVKTTKVTVTSDLAQYWRATYDILVRPKGSRSQVEKDYGLVEANYLSNIQGGITLQQVQAIRDIPGVDVAAPLAVLGNFALQFYVPLPVDCQPGFYRLENGIVSSDGLRDYKNTGAEYFFCNPEDGNFYHLFNTSQYAVNMLNFSPGFSSANPGAVDPNSLPWFKGTVFRIPVLLAAIDPGQESKLVGLDKAMLQGAYLDTLASSATQNNVFPVIFNSRIYASFDLQTEWKRIDLPFSPETLNQARSDAGQQLLANRTAKTLQSWKFSGQEAYTTALKSLEMRKDQPQFQGLTNLPSGIEYQKAAHLSELNLPTFEPTAYGLSPSTGNYVALTMATILDDPKNNFEMAFRKSGLGSGGGGFSFFMQGIYAIERLGQTSGPAEVPMETYSPPKAILLYDEAGKPVDPVALTPTLSDTGYLISPPLALTTLDAAPILNFSNQDAPISAIRVRVAGVNGYSPEAKASIERIASEIIDRTGLDVDVVVGSSPQKVLVHIPGKDPVPPAGYVQEGWSQMGASYKIGYEVEQINVALFAIMLLVCGLYILNTSMMSTLARRREIAIQKALGWKSSAVFTLVLAEGLLAGLAGGLLGLALASGLAAALKLDLPIGQALWIIPLGLGLCLTGSLLPAVRAARISPARMLAQGEISGRRMPSGRLSIPAYAWRQIWQRPSRAVLALSTISIAAALLTLFLGITFYLRGYLSGTFLGETILAHIGGIQYVIAAISFLIAGFAVTDVLLMAVMERKREIGVLKATGWRNRSVSNLFLWEAAGLAAAGGFLGWLAGSLFLLNVFQLSIPAVLELLLPALLIPAAVALIAALYPARQATRIPPSEAMRYE